jgi:hypothetical protein
MRNAAFLIVLFACTAAAQQQSQPSTRHAASIQEPAPESPIGERNFVITELESLYGRSVDETTPIFAITQDFVLTPAFSADGLLIQFAVEAKDKLNPYHGNDQMQLSPVEFDLLLSRLNSIKALGPLEEEDPVHIVVGVRGNNKRYQNAYLIAAELLGPLGQPAPIQHAYVYYLHGVTGVPITSQEPERGDAYSFGAICVDGNSYMAPKVEYFKIWSRRNLPQALRLAGPTGDKCGY